MPLGAILHIRRLWSLINGGIFGGKLGMLRKVGLFIDNGAIQKIVGFWPTSDITSVIDLYSFIHIYLYPHIYKSTYNQIGN